jgi:iron(III) transport system substrate-binding protein
MLAGAGLTGLGATRAHAAPSPALVEAAKREGRVVVYSAYISPVTHGRIATAFEKAYGIKIEYLTARGAELRERARIEQSAGRFLGDVQHTASSVAALTISADKSVEAHGGLPNAKRLKPEFASRADDMQTPIFTINYGMLINTSMVKPADEPKSWMDLLDPKWKGKLGAESDDGDWFGTVIKSMKDPNGLDLFRKIASTNGISMRKGHTLLANLTASGEVPLSIAIYEYKIQQMKLAGAPVDFFYLDPLVVHPVGIGIAKRAATRVQTAAAE